MITQSSHMQAHEYDPETQQAFVQFQNGAVYRVDGMAQWEYDNFRQASSPGQYWHNKIKGQKTITLVSPGSTKSGKVSKRRW